MKTGAIARHASFDWSDPANFEKFGDATGLEVPSCFCCFFAAPPLTRVCVLRARVCDAQVVLEAGDILYIPAHWFHYIVSLTTNAQCNTRSGTPDTYSDAINKCGFRTHVTEGA